MIAAKIMDVIARLPGFDGQADAVSAFSHVKLEVGPRLLKISKLECPDGLDTSSTTQMAQIMVKH